MAYDLGRRATAARPPKARPGARVSQNFASRAILVFPKTSPAPQVPAVPPREPPLEPRPAGKLSLSASRLGWRHALDEGSPADGNVSRAGDECGGVGVGTERRFDKARLAGAPHESVQTHMPHAPRKRG